MKTSDALGDIAERLLADGAVAALVGREIHIDYPGDLAAVDPNYRPANSGPFVFFDALAKTPLTDCGGYQCKFRIVAESFAADRREAHDVIDAVVAALDERFGAAPLAVDLSFVAGGDIIDALSPRSAYADFTFTL